MMGRVRDSLYLFLVGIGLSGMLAACGGDDGTGNGNGNGNGQVDYATVSGSVEAVAADLDRLRLGSSPRPGAASSSRQPEPDSVFVGTPRNNGNIDVAARGDMPEADSYSVEDVVPPARRRLIVAVLDSDGNHIGRVLVYARTEPGGEVVNEPLNIETSLEGGIVMGANLEEFTTPEGLIHNVQVGLTHRMSEANAELGATTRVNLTALVNAYKLGQELFLRSFRSNSLDLPYDSLEVNPILREDAGQPYAEARNAGTGIQAAHEDFIDASLDIYLDHIGDAVGHAVAWGGFATLHDATLVDEDADSGIRLEMAQNLLNISVQARQKLVESTSAPDDAKAAVSDALDDIRSQALSAGSMSELVSSRNSARDDGVFDLEVALGRDVDEAAADLGAFIDRSQSPEEIAPTLPDYLAQVESAEDDAGVQDLLIALMGGPGYP